jgi:hypothetical protein
VEEGKWASSKRLAVRFSGGRARVGPMTAGQANMRRCVLEDDPSSINARMIIKPPADGTLDRIAELITVMVLRHEGLRTTLPASSPATQSVAAAGELSLPVYESGGASDECALEIAGRMRAIRFDPAAELPIRVAVIVTDGVPVWVIFVLSHVAVDTIGQRLFRREWSALAAGQQLPPPAALQPVDLGEWEQTAAGQRRVTSPLRYWEDLLRTTPQAMFAAPGIGPTDWMLPRLEVRSRAAALALARIAARTGASPGTVVLAAMCALIGYRLSVRTCVVAIVAVNRFLPELTDYFGTIAQDALMSADLDVATFDEVVGRVRDRSLTAYRRSHFNPEELWKLIAKVEDQRGTHWARDCVFSDATGLAAAGLAPAPSALGDPDIDSISGHDIQLTWVESSWVASRLQLTADRLEGEVEFSMWAEPQCLPAPDAEEFAAALVRLIIEAAGRDVPLDELSGLARFRPVERGAGWYLIDSCWIELEGVRRLLSQVVGGLPNHVVAVPDATLGYRLECYVAVGSAALSPERIHADCVAALAMWPNAMAPHHYVLCERAPADPAEIAEWRAQVCTASGNGRVLAPVMAEAATP